MNDELTLITKKRLDELLSKEKAHAELAKELVAALEKSQNRLEDIEDGNYWMGVQRDSIVRLKEIVKVLMLTMNYYADTIFWNDTLPAAPHSFIDDDDTEIIGNNILGGRRARAALKQTDKLLEDKLLCFTK